MNKIEFHARLFEIVALLQDSLKRLALKTIHGEAINKILVECIHARLGTIDVGALDAGGRVKMTVPHVPQWDTALQTGYATLRIEAMYPNHSTPEVIPGIRLTGMGGMPLALLDQVFPYLGDDKVVTWMTEIVDTAILFARWGAENNFKPDLKKYYLDDMRGQPFGGTPQ